MKLDLPDADIHYFPGWLDTELANDIYVRLQKELAWHQGDVFVFGKWHKTPRLQAFHGDQNLGYSYSGKPLESYPWSPALLLIKEKLQDLGYEPNVVLANCYRDGNDKMGWHRDNEPELGQNPTILSLSLGAERDFHLRHVVTKDRVDLKLEHGSLLVMGGESQHCWEHQLPSRKRISEPRINLTFRKII